MRYILTEKVGNLLEYSNYDEAPEYFRSINLWLARPSLGPAAAVKPQTIEVWNCTVPAKHR